ncbi:hypothetical protein L210DRAFT_3761890 [Boletus edulis BED1]|uniref:Uncharacterized protein n=1 Tax=Boletus edulis BED1 TaxID=1328754 RepID=A0AAD4GDC4_BOLED|nr:hypothetical protein L210DRAFT_3761890 [Boletus edulis BED1]
MLATHALSLSLHSSPSPNARPSLFPGSRPPLADSTNVSSCTDVGISGCPKSLVYPTSVTRTVCSWSDVKSSTGSNSSPFHFRHHPLSSTPSPFPVTCKAPPTVSISLSAVCSQSIPGELIGGPEARGLEPDLPDVRSVVPFPSSPLDDDMDVEMFDGTCVPRSDGALQSVGHAPRKRRSAHSSVSSLPGGLGKDAKQKRPRKSKRQVTELWWLGVVHRSILRSIEARQSAGELDSSTKSLSGLRDLGAMDHVLIGKIQKRLAENGYSEGSLPSPFPRISSPSISVPSLNLLAPSREILATGPAPLNPKENITISRTATTSTSSEASTRASYSPIPPSTSTSHRRHVRFEIARHPRQPPTIPRRSPSPPARTGSVSTNAQTLTLTIPQLVATLTLAYHERSGLRLRRRTYKATDCGQNTGCSPPSVPCQVVQCGNADATQDKERTHQLRTLRARLSSAPERKSLLSRVVYAEG